MAEEFNPQEFESFKGGNANQATFEPSEFESFKQHSMAWSDVPGQALKNVPHSALEFGKSLVQPFVHPIETATSLKNIGQGVLEKAGIMSPADHEKYADAVGKFFMDRYGSVEGIKNTLATDPVGALGDLSTVLTAGGGLAVRGAGLTGKAAQIAQIPGRITNPTVALAKGAELTGRGAAQVIGAVGTHTGPEAIELAAQAGREGGQPAKAFKESIRGVAPMEEAVEEARSAESLMRKKRSDAYEQAMRPIVAASGYRTLPFTNIDNALADAEKIGKYRGAVVKPDVVAAHQKVKDIVDTWRGYPVQFHTLEGMDKLKQAVGEVLKNQEANSAEKLVAGKVYNAIRDEIVSASPQYGKVMKAYEKAIGQLDELDRTLSLNPNATIDTALRKLQSTLRDNVNTSYGRRRELAEFLVKNGAPNLLYKLAGQTMKPFAPRGLGRFALTLGAEIAGIIGATAIGGPHGLALAAGLPFMSPHVVGMGAYGLGAASRYAPNLGAYQMGRLPTVQGSGSFKKGGRVIRSFRVRT